MTYKNIIVLVKTTLVLSFRRWDFKDVSNQREFTLGPHANTPKNGIIQKNFSRFSLTLIVGVPLCKGVMWVSLKTFKKEGLHII